MSAATINGESFSEVECEYRTRFWPRLIDERAESGYPRPFAYVARSRNPQDGFLEISYARLANAINRASWWIVNELSDSVGEKEVFAYFGPNDLRYLIFSVASMKTGRRILLPSIRNTAEAQKTLFQRVHCKLIIFAASIEKSLESVFSSVSDMSIEMAPSVDELLLESSVPPFIFQEIGDAEVNDPVIYFHTSGSSGNPKPIPYNVAALLNLTSMNIVPPDYGRSPVAAMLQNQNHLSLFPGFHLAGFIFSVLAVTFEAVAVLGHPDVAPTPEHVVSLLNQDVVTTLSAPPSLLDGLSRLPAGIEALSQLEHVGYAGGPLSEHVGQILAPKLKHLCSLIGSTEYGFFHMISGGSSKWAYLRFHPDVGYRFDEISDGEFELVIPNDPKTRKYHGTTRTFPELDEYRTKDLYSIVPGEQGWMRYVGRRDDLIVLSNGEKVNPVPLEDIICSHPAVKGAVIVGEHRFLPSLLIELQDGFHGSGKELHEMLDTIWPIVAEANQTAPRFCRMPKSLIYFVPREKPFNRAGKGTIQRQVTIRKFANELRELYAAAEQGLLMEGLEFQNPYDRDSTRAFVKSLYTQTLDVERLSDEEDVFELGMDSLQVAIAIQKLRATLRSQHLEANPSQLNAQLIYSSPTVNKLSDALYSLIKGGGCPHPNGSVNASHERFDYLQQVLDRYLTGLPTKLITGNRKDAGTFNVVLTGSTGSLGSYLLATLLSSPKVSKVICLNRSKDSEKRQRASQKSRGLAISWDGADKQRCEFLTADLLKPDFGLGDRRYERLVSEAAAVIHCGWKVDFNHSLESFEKITLAGMRNLIDLSANAKSQAPILFVSSISTVLNWIDTHPDAPVPEAVLHDLEAPEKLGYAESKYIGERLLEDFTRSSGIPNAVLRVGQIAGPVQSSSGCWNTQEWFPSLVASSKYLGMLPESLGKLDSIDWIPVDILALIIVQLLELIHDNVSNQGQSETPPSPAVYNLVNPKVTEWGALFPAVQDELGGESNVRIVPLEEWVQALENSASENHGYIVPENPAVKLLDFFKILGKGASQYAETSKLRYEVGRLVRDSPRAAKLGPVSPKWIRLWMKQWKL